MSDHPRLPFRRKASRPNEALLAAAVLAALAGAAGAQQFAAAGHAESILPPKSHATADVAFGDVDGDGDLDVVVGNGANYAALGEPNTLRLDPTQMVALPPILLPAPGNVGRLSFTLPRTASLIGASLHSQAVTWHYPLQLGAALTNVVVDVVVQ